MPESGTGIPRADTREILLQLQSDIRAIAATVADIRSLVGPFGALLPDGNMLVQTLFGNKYIIDPLDLIIAPNLIVYRQWEAELSAFFNMALTPDTVFVDVGANFGYFTCLAGSRIGLSGTGRVFAIEPNPKCAELLRKNVLINWSMCPVEVFQNAVAERECTLELIVPKNRAANAHLGPSGDRPLEPYQDIFEVSVRPLDSIIPEGKVVDLMKIDVEGHEFAALSGARAVISRSPDIRIVMEWSPGQMKNAGYTAVRVYELLREHDLRAYRLPSGGSFDGAGASEKISVSDLSAMSYDNILLTRRK